MSPLKVPMFFQPHGTPYCGPACIRMILAHHGRRMNLQKIVGDLPMRSSGVDIASMGTFFLKKGFEARLVIWLPTFPNKFLEFTKEAEARREVLAWCKRKAMMTWKGYDDELFRKTLPVFIKNGGGIIPKPVSLKDLKESIRRNCPPIMNLNAAMLYKLPRKKYAGHYVVLAFVDDEKMTFNDPNRPYGGTRTHSLELVLSSCYMWGGGALFVKPK